MKNKIYNCPCCGEDISVFVHGEIVLHNRQRNAERMRQAQNKDPKERERLTLESQRRLAKWRKENPDAAKESAQKASAARTRETFEQQAESVKETQRRKTIRFAELMMKAKSEGVNITPEFERELLERSRLEVKAELKEERKAAKKSAAKAQKL